MPKILVYGWYYKNNIGDDLFIDAFKHLFSSYEFLFTDSITSESLSGISAVFFGGGSFLDSEPDITKDALQLLLKMKICYIGVGTETDVCKTHQFLMSRAKLIATRSNLDTALKFNKNSILIPDIVMCLPTSKNTIRSESILVVPNFCVVPQWNDPYWKHVSWLHFKSEFSQTLDFLVEKNYDIHFFGMCENKFIKDTWAATEIINSMINKGDYIKYLHEGESTVEFFSKYKMIISQRYHGGVIAELTKTPYITIHHHDKLKYAYPGNGKLISFYSLEKQKLIDMINENTSNILPIENNIFDGLKLAISNIVNE